MATLPEIQWRDIRNEQDALLSDFGRHGAGFFSGFHDRQDLHKLLARMGETFHHPHAERDGVTSISVKPGDHRAAGRLGLTNLALFPHTDRSVSKVPPSVIIQVISHSSAIGGDAIVVDGEKVVQDIASTNMSLVRALAQPETAIFTSGSERRCCSILEQVNDGTLRIRYRNDHGIHIAPHLAEAFAQLTESIRAAITTIPLQQGNGYVLDNWRWVHGRSGFSGNRTLLRLLGTHIQTCSGLETAFGIRATIPKG